MIRTSRELKSEFVQSVRYEAKVLEVFAQRSIPKYEGIVDDTDIATVQVIGKVTMVSHAYHTCEVDEDGKPMMSQKPSLLSAVYPRPMKKFKLT